MASKLIWAELNYDGYAIRIFKNRKAMVMALPYFEDGPAKQMDRREAVSQIRHQIFVNQGGQCKYCPTRFSEAQMHMHEKIHRGKGGEISLENSVGLCAACHIGPSGEHSDRQVRKVKNVDR